VEIHRVSSFLPAGIPGPWAGKETIEASPQRRKAGLPLRSNPRSTAVRQNLREMCLRLRFKAPEMPVQAKVCVQ